MLCSPPTTDSLPPGGSVPHTTGWQPAKYSRAPKPAGGFALLPLEALVLPWLAYERGVIAPLALRGYLAGIEMRERRCGATPETPTAYTTEELRRLLGTTVRPSTASAVRQALVAGGLLTWPDDGHQVALCPQGTTVPWLDLPRYTALRTAIHPSVQQLPLPRRLLTWLATEGAPGLIATVLGVACRTLRYRDHQVIAGGSLVPAWVAATFQIARRTVAHWLQRLRALHWLAPLATPPAHRRAYGPWVAINLRWALPVAAADTARASPPHACSRESGNTSPGKSLAPTRHHAPAVLRPSTDPCPLRPQAHNIPILPPPMPRDRATSPRVASEGTARATAASDPATYYATLPPKVQATLYQEAETRLLQHHPRAFVIRPTVLAEIYRGLETVALYPSETPRLGAISPPPTTGHDSPTNQNLATASSSERTNLASTRKNLANITPLSLSISLGKSRSFPLAPRQDENPFQETQPTKHHNNLTTQPKHGVDPGVQETLPLDPAVHPSALSPLKPPLQQEATLPAPYEGVFGMQPLVLEELSPTLPPMYPVPGRGDPAALETLAPDFPRSLAMDHQEFHTPPPDSTAVATPPPPVPCLNGITPADLAAVSRLQYLWQAAQARGWIGGSDADWLTVVTTAQHALRVGSNPGGLFVAVLHRHAWHLLTQADEDAARQALRAAHGTLTPAERLILHRLFGRGAREPTLPQVPPLSREAQCAREALRLCQSARWSGDPFTVVKAAEPAWTRARWEAALVELEQWQLLQQVTNARQRERHPLVSPVDEPAGEATAGEHDGDDEP